VIVPTFEVLSISKHPEVKAFDFGVMEQGLAGDDAAEANPIPPELSKS